MAKESIEHLKRLTLVALFSEDELVHRLVLKGGNALNIAYGLHARASFDLDFSMEGQFEPNELERIRSRVQHRLTQVFSPEGYVVFDVTLESKPDVITADMQSFWGGYDLQFRLIPRRRYDELGGELRAIRREAIPHRPRGKARFEIDISRHEYCKGRRTILIEDFTIPVYTPEMVVCEKLRAICQQAPAYAATMQRHATPRARDFFDIHHVITHLDVTLPSKDNLEILKSMFAAKRVPLKLLASLDEQRDFHRQNWDALRDTVSPLIQLREYDFYFDFVLNLCRDLSQAMRCSPFGT